ncbi:MAG: DUF6675 family protein [Reyranella sp.]
MLRRALILAPVLIPAIAQAAPKPLAPPCGQAPAPPYPSAGQAPNAAVWDEPDLKRLSWRPPGCLRWDNVRTRLVAALAGQFQSPRTLDEHAARLGQVSALPAVRYWSVTKAQWMPLVSGAGLLDGPEGEAIPDPAPAELKTGSAFHYFETGRAGRTVHRLSVYERSADRIVVATENVTPIRLAILTAFEPEALQSVTFIERRGAGLWGYYQTIRATEGANTLALGKDASYLNRLAALYRHTAGIPTDQEPPLAR